MASILPHQPSSYPFQVIDVIDMIQLFLIRGHLILMMEKIIYYRRKRKIMLAATLSRIRNILEKVGL
jgi:hypothetical protein